MRALGLVVLALAACGDGSGAPADATSASDTTNEVQDATAVDDTAIATSVTDTTVASDADAPDAVDAADSGDAADAERTFALACSEGSSCAVACGRGRCEDGVCRFDGPHPGVGGCVVPLADDAARAECVDIGAGRPGAATCIFCNPAVSGEGYGNVAFADGFEAGGSQVEVERLVQNPATWSVSSARAATGAHSLYFGDPTTGTYDVGERAAAIAETLPLRVPSGTELTLAFQLWAESEETPGFDRLRVLLVRDGADARELWTSDAIGGTTGGVFVPVTLALGAVESGDRVAFEADTKDGIINSFEGFYLDDLRIATTCCDPAAATAGDCDDNNLCTSDECVAVAGGSGGDEGGACSHQSIAGCCLSDAYCDDGDPCTEDHCSGAGGTCSRTAIADCCADAADCDDGDPCTEDRCGGVACEHAPICCAQSSDCDDGDPCTSGRCDDGQCVYNNTCCRGDGDCDDGLACTDDRCQDGICQNAFTYAPGCCIPDVLTERFDAGAPAGWTLTPIVNNVGWQVVASADAQSPPSLLYYGHKTLHFYETGGRNSGTAVTPFVRVPDGVQLDLSFDILADVEASATRDVLTVEALVGGELVPLLTKADLVLGSWQPIDIDLSWAAGQLVQVRFVFDTIDGVANTRRGVFLDDVRILSSCLAPACSGDAQCPGPASLPDAACLQGTCTEGTCRYGKSCP
ncbi:MAG: hypothetical protein U1F43_14005 [Myxococcota bacterium]